MRLIFIVLLGWISLSLHAQDFTRHNWYFGNSVQGIRFNRPDNTPELVTNQKIPFGNGGSAVATNPINADLMFYTDGSRVYDISASLTPMPNGTGLAGNTSGNQPAAISPVPGAPNQYYIFTNSASGASGGSVLFSIVDMTQFGNALFPAPATGDVTSKNQAFGIAPNSRSEAMITIPHANHTDYWLITHENGTDNYTVSHIQAGGNFTHTTFSGLTGGLSISASNFAYHAGTGKIAVTPHTANRNLIILNFDNNTGDLSFDSFVLNTASATDDALFDTEWSFSGRFLYISRLNDTGTDAQVLQFDTSNPGTTITPILPAAPARSYGLQIGPDTTIYHIYQPILGGPFRVGRIADTDSIASLVQYETAAFTANPDVNGRQFPSFSPSPDLDLTVTFITAGTCSNVATSFYPTVTPAADSLVWDFGDGNGSNAWSPVHTYEGGGAYPATVTAFLNGKSATFTAPVSITQFNLQINLVQDTVGCKCEFPVNKPTPVCQGDTSPAFSVTAQIQGGQPTSIIWSNGDTGPTLTPDSAGFYYVVVTDATGCQAYASVNVREYGATDQRANIWYFGQNAGINFNLQPGVAITGPINTPEGVSVISDRNGNVILSTNGQQVFNRKNVDITPAPFPPGAGGDPGSTQSALIIPVAGDETLYYIFTTQEVHGTGTYELRYTLFDLKLNNGDGGIAQHNQLLFARSTERITGNGGWLIAHEFGNNSFRAYPVSAAGIGNPVITSIGSDHTLNDEITGRGYMKLGGNNILAVALSTTGVSNVLELFDFENTTGKLSNFRTANLNSVSGQVYGVEFAGNKIFATLTGNPSLIREFYIDYQGNPVLITPSAGPVTGELGAIQLGPDGQIYVAVNNQTSLGTILVNPDTLATSTFVLTGFPLAGGTRSQLGLPNFIQNVGNAPQPASMLISGFCLGEPTLFSGSGTDIIDIFLWSFGDGIGSDSAVVSHTYLAAQDYVVTLNVSNRCGLDTTLIQTITIFPPPANPSFLLPGQFPVICDGPLTLEATPATNPDLPDLTFLWSTQETTRTITVEQTSLVRVTITNTVSGCTSNGALIVADNRPQVDLGPDRTVCQNEAIFPLNASNPNAQHAWTINAIPAGTAQTQSVDTSLPGVFTYAVTVTDPITTCQVTEDIVFTIGQSPGITALASPSSCGVANGSLSITINAPVGGLFSYFISGPNTNLQDIDRSTGPIVNAGLTALGAGIYGITVLDQVSGCASVVALGINDNLIDITSALAQSPTCTPIAIDIQTTGILNFGTATYSIVDAGTSATVIPQTSFGTATFSTTPVAVPGSYIIQVNADGCITTEPVDIVSDPLVPVVLSPDVCNFEITAAAPGATFDWSASPSGSITQIINSPGQSVADLAVGTWDLVVTAVDGVNCPNTQTINVQVDPPILADFTQSDACEDNVTLTATPAGAFTYQWFDGNNNLVPGGSSINIGLSENGRTYGLQARNTVTGCLSSRVDKQVFVAGDLVLGITTTTPCSGSPFTLTGVSNISGTNFQWGVDGNNIPGATQNTLTVSAAGRYRLTGTLPGCTETVESQIVLFPRTPGSLVDRVLICPDPSNPDPNTREVTLDAGPNFINYNWFLGGAPLNVFTQTYTTDVPGLYSVLLTNSFGCISDDQTDVVEECKPRLVAPTAFRPGSTVSNPGDGSRTNSEFWVLPLFIDDDGFQVFIFNRWGEMVYQSTDRNFRWNGGYNNNLAQLLPAGTYTYVVRYKSIYRPQDGIKEQRGGVLLVR
ncbi:MAG: PKD domain-containing protein [Cyclobacteriaceae bacterium]|nr:PKD domain-containing protein [Cyclobacteriaceae bacterium]